MLHLMRSFDIRYLALSLKKRPKYLALSQSQSLSTNTPLFYYATKSAPPMSAPTLETPTLDSQLPSLLHQITEEGGYAFTSIATRAAAGDTRAAEAAREMAWEQLHSGPWHSVVPIWRDAYAMACLHVAKCHFSSGELEQALRALDMGLIMGGFTLRDDLNFCIRKVTAALRERDSAHTGGGPQQKAQWYRDFNLAEVRFVSLSLSLSLFPSLKDSI